MKQSLLDYYKAIESASSQMLAAAQAEDWEQVVKLEGACAVLIGQLHDHASSATLSPQERPEKAKIMLRILRNDAEIRHLAEPWLSELDGLMDQSAAPKYLH